MSNLDEGTGEEPNARSRYRKPRQSATSGSRMLFAAILMFCAIGVFSVSNSAFEVVLAAFFGGVGYVFMKLGCEIAPLILGFVLGPMLEENLRRSLLITDGDFSVFIMRPISLTLLLIALGLLLATALPAIQARRAEAFNE